MFKIFKKALSVTLSVTLLISTILVGGMFSFSASAATDLSGTSMPLTYTFDFNDDSDVPVTAFGETLTDQFGNTFYPVHDQGDDGNLSISQQDITVGESQVGALNINVPTGSFSYTPTDANGNPYIIEPNTEYKIRVKLYIVSVSTYCGIVVGGGAFGASVASSLTESGYNFFASHTGTAGGGDALLADQTAQGFFPLYKAHQNNGAFETGTRPGSYNGSPSCSGIISHWAAYAEDLTYSRVRDFTLPMRTGDFTLVNGEFVDSTGDRVRPYLTIGGIGGLNYMIDSITIEKEAKVTLDANGGYFGDFDAVNPTTTATASGFAGTAISTVPSHPDSSTTFVGWSLDGVNVIDTATFSDAIAGKTLYALWEEESLTYTFNFDTYDNYEAQNANVKASAAGQSTDQNGKTFYPVIGNDAHTYSVTGENIVVNGKDISTVKLTTKYTGSQPMVMRFIPTDENGKPYITTPGTKYKISVTYAAQNLMYGYNIHVGSGAINPFTGDIGKNNMRWLSSFPITYTAADGNVYATSDTTNPLESFDEYGYEPHTTALPMATTPVSNSTIEDLQFVTESRIINTNEAAITDGKYTFSYNGSSWDVAPYIVITLNRNGGIETAANAENCIYIDSITVTEVEDNVTVNFDANGGSFGDATTTSATLTPGEAIDVTTPTQRGAKLVGWSWYKNGPVVDTVTTGMAGKTLYAVWAPAGSVELNANGGYFGDYAEENATVTSFIYEGDTIADYAPSYPDSSAKLVGWMLEGEIIDETTVTADLVGKTLYALWAEEDLVYDITFDEGTFMEASYDSESGAYTSTTDKYGQTIYLMKNQQTDVTASYEEITVKDFNGNVSTKTTLKLDNSTSGGRGYFILTDENGKPYAIEPGATYNIKTHIYIRQSANSNALYIGAGAAWPTYKSATFSMGNAWYSWAGTAGTETSNINGFFPLYRGYGSGTEGSGGPATMLTNGGLTQLTNAREYAEGVIDVSVERTREYNYDLTMTVPEYSATNGIFSQANTGGAETWQFGGYLAIGMENPKSIYNIDYITVTKVEDDITVNFDANGGTLDSTSATLTPGDSIEVEPTHSDASYQFVGWSWYKDTYVPATVATTGMDDATLYAYWEQMVPVTFDANGGTLVGQESITQYYYVGNEITLPATPEKRFNTFKGWAESADSDVIVDLPANATLDMVGKTYYAVWEPVLHGDDYNTFTRVVDYSTYTVIPASNMHGNSWAGYLSLVEDETATGGKYLRYDNTSAANVVGTWTANWNLTMTASGYADGTAGSDNNLAFPENTTYRVTMRVRTHQFEGDGGVMYVCYGNSDAVAAYDCKDKTTILTGIPETNGEWVNIVAYFTTPAAYTDGYNRAFIGLMPTANGGYTKYDIDTLTLERVTATTLYTVDGGVATEAKTVYGVPGADLVLPTEVSKENYAANGTATVSRTPVTGWFADSALETAAVIKFANIDVNIYGKVEGETTTTSAVNQKLFCGFDSYAMNGSVVSFITDEEAYTGNFSAKAANLTDIEVRNTNDLMLKAGKTYKVSFSYKRIDAVDDTAGVTVGLSDGTSFIEKNVAELALGGEWMNASAVITADKGMADGYALVLRANGVYIDNVVVSSVTDVIGAFTDDDTNIRFMMGYTLTGDKIVIEGAEYTIVKRGINIMGEGSTEPVLTFTRDADLTANCWNYDEATGELVFSANINIDGSFESNKVVAQGYVVLDDGTTFYTDYITASREDVTSVDALVSDAYANGLYVYLPEGTALAADAASAATFYNLFVSGAVEAQNVLSDGVMTYGAYAKFSAEPAKGAITVPASLQYLIHSGTYEELCAGVDAYVASYKLDQVGEDAVNYIFITDLHFDNNNPEVTRQVELIANMANSDDSIDMVVVGGDVTTGMFATKEAAIEASQTALAPLQSCDKPVIVLRGNHDDNTYGDAFDKQNPAGVIVSDLDWEMDINRFVNDESVYSNFVHNSVLPNSAYYYFDIEKNGKTTRVIALNACDQDLSYDEDGNIATVPVSVRSWEITDGLLTEGRNVTYGVGLSMYGYSSRQMKWLAEEALNGFDGDIIVLSHMGTDGHAQGNASVTPVKNSEALNKILNAYQTKGTYNGTLRDELADVYNLETREYTERESVKVSADFSSTDGKVLIYQYGHTHIEMVTYYSAANMWEINTATANYVNAPKDYDAQLNKMNQNYPWNIATLEQRTSNNDTACFDVVSAGSNVVYKFNVGFGEDATMVIPR